MDSDAAARPRFRSSVEPIVDADDGLFLLTEGSHVWLPGTLHADLAPLLDGQHTVEAVFEQLAGRHEPADVLAALDGLRAQHLLAEYAADDVTDMPRSERAWWERCGVSPALARQRVDETVVELHALGGADASALRVALANAGLRVGSPGSLAVVVCADTLAPELAAFNEQALARSQAWLLVQPWGLQTWLGPAFVPGQTACWACLAQRLRWHRRLEAHLAGRHAATLARRAHGAHNGSSTRASFEEAAAAMLRWVGTGNPGSLAGQVLVTDSLSHDRTRHGVVRRPQCPACGDASMRGSRPFTLQPRPKSAARDGGHRALDADSVATQLERHVSPVTGLVAGVMPGERTAPPGPARSSPVATFAADHNFSDMADRRFFLREGLRRRSGGKGQTAAQARTSALAESLERYSGVFDGTEPRVRASARGLGSAALHPNSVLGFSARQYAGREEANRREHKAHWVPEPFRDDVLIDWTPLWSLTQQRVRHLPTSQCYFGYSSADPVFARADSNGCAAGAVPEEAVLQGLLELIERDAVALWWYSRVQRRSVALASSRDPYVAALQSHYRSLRRSLWVLDITSDLGVPCFAALSARTDQARQDILYGFGAHLDPAVALSRALTELNQSLDAVPLAGGPPGSNTYRGSQDALQWWTTATLQNQPYLRPSDHAPLQLPELADASTEHLDADVWLLVQRLAGQDIEVLVLDQTRPDVGLPVVRVVAPGLRHFWARFGPGRLYQVPVQQGWIPRPLDEAELNPLVIQF